MLEALVLNIPEPKGDPDKPLKALIIDSWFDSYVGVITLIRVFDGCLKPKQKIVSMSTGRNFQVEKLGVFTPKRVDRSELSAGEVGFLICGIKDISSAKVGDTLTSADTQAEKALPGFKEVNPNVFAGIFPVNADDYENFRDALDKLKLNDASFSFEPETSQALGFGFRCGFLGMLHMEIVQERLEREYDLDLITTAPTVVYQIHLTSGEIMQIHNPSQLPPPNKVDSIHEPVITANILVPHEFVGNVITLCIEKRGIQKNLVYHGSQVAITFDIPLNEVVLDFFDRLKSVSRGYASFDYQHSHFSPAPLVKLDILINSERVDALSVIVHSDHSRTYGNALAVKLKDLIPRQMYDVAIQAAIGTQIIARTSIKALRKNVTAKCYGGDITRKKKLLEKQKAGKKRMKQIGSVEVPQAAFLAVLKVGK